jgi:pseudouridine-5'-phosphate glycosidase
MMNNISKSLILEPAVRQAIDARLPVVALESTVITHGLPYPQNLQLALDMEAEIRQQNAVPATIALLDGEIHIGLNQLQLERLALHMDMVKVSVRDIAPTIANKRSGGTTVAGTLFAANLVGIKVFATGGIGGVHRGAAFDISADLVQLARTPVILVCAGAKAILDLPATLEVLETYGVPVVGYQTDEFPAFYSRTSGLPVSCRADNPEHVAHIAKTHWNLGMTSAILVCVPPPAEAALPPESVQEAIEQALVEAHEANISGQGVTPYLLRRVNELTAGNCMRANLALLRNNARLAGQIAQYV